MIDSRAALAVLLLLLLLLPVPELTAQFAGYGGPAILDRPGTGASRSGGRPVRLRAYVSTLGLYASGLLAPIMEDEGELPKDHTFGYALQAGLMGSHQTSRSVSSVDLSGIYNRFTRRTMFTGPSAFLGTSHTRQMTRRVTLSARASGFTQEIVWPQRLTPLSPDLPPIPADPTQEIFDNRLTGGTVSATIGYQPTARLTMQAQGSAFTFQRRSAALVSFGGGGATGMLDYTLDRNQSIGATYEYNTVFFRRQFGEMQFMTWMGNYGRRLSPRWYLRLSCGVYQMSYDRLQSIEVDPLIAALTGDRTTLIATSGTRYGAAATGLLSAAFRRSSVGIQYFRGAQPTNGVILAAEREGGTVSYSFTGIRNLNVGAVVSHIRLKSRFDRADSFDSSGAGAGLNYRLHGPIFFTANYNYLRFDIRSFSTVSRNRSFAAVGITISPGEVPLSLF